MSVQTRIAQYVNDAGRAVERAPLEVVLAVLVALGFSWALEAEGDAYRVWAELAVVAVLMLAGAWGATLLHALGVLTLRQRLAATLLVALAAGAYGAVLLDFRLGTEAWRAVLLLAAATAGVAAVPALGAARAERTAVLRRVGGRFVLRTCAALLYACALFAGLALALAAVNTLFELGWEGRIYAHVGGWIFLLLVPWVVAGGLPDFVRDDAADERVARAVHRLSAFLVPPLLAVYLAILYAYAVRIGVTGEVPKNLLSPLVIAAGLLAGLALLLFEPRPDGRGGIAWLRAAPPLFIPLGVLGIWAITLRTTQYGWTEFRIARLVLLAALLALAVAGTVQLWRRTRFALHGALVVLAGVALLAAVGPWSVSALARRSQQAELAGALADAGVRADVRRDPSADTITVAAATYDRISSVAGYLVMHHGSGALPPVLAAHARAAGRWNLAGAIGLRRAPSDDEIVRGVAPASLALRTGAAVPIADGALALRVNYAEGRRRGARADSEPTVLRDGALLHVRLGNAIWTADITPLLALLETAAREDGRRGGGGSELEPGEAALPLVDGAGRARGTLVVYNVYAEQGEGVLSVLQLDGVAVVARD